MNVSNLILIGGGLWLWSRYRQAAGPVPIAASFEGWFMEATPAGQSPRGIQPATDGSLTLIRQAESGGLEAVAATVTPQGVLSVPAWFDGAMVTGQLAPGGSVVTFSNGVAWIRTNAAAALLQGAASFAQGF